MTEPNEKKRFDNLDGLRGIAALVVLMGHASGFFFETTELISRYALAVNFFFMLSGFVISYSYGNRLDGGHAILQFLARRVIRLYPLIVFSTVLGSIYWAITTPTAIAELRTGLSVLTSLMAIPGPYTNFSFGHFPVNPPEWSLFYEMIAYIVFALFVKNLKVYSLGVFVIVAGFLYAFARSKDLESTHEVFFYLSSVAVSFNIGVLVQKTSRLALFGRIGNLPFFASSAILIIACALPQSLGANVDIIIVVFIFPVLLILESDSTTRHGTARHGTARHGTARHGTARHGTARHGTARHQKTTRQYFISCLPSSLADSARR